MELISAEQARTQSTAIIRNEIHSLINNGIESGEMQTSGIEYIPDEIQQELQNQGYQINEYDDEEKPGRTIKYITW